jgi:hypothetical protein
VTFQAILQDVYARLNNGAAPVPSVVARYSAFANETHRQLLTLPGLDSLRDETTTVATVANASRSALPPSLARVQRIQDRTNMRLLKPLTLTEIRRRDPGLTATGTPITYALVGTVQVGAQPSAATGVWAVSSSASDTVPQVNVEAIRTGGYLHTPAAATLTGTTRVQVGTQTDYTEITKFYLNAVCVGDVTLYDAVSAGNVLAVIPKGQTYARYIAIQWYPIPATAQTFYVDYTRRLTELVNPTDEPLLPEDFHWLIACGVRWKEYEKADDARYATAKAEFEQGVKGLRNWAQTDGGSLVSLRARRRSPVPSQLGAWYEPGT